MLTAGHLCHATGATRDVDFYPLLFYPVLVPTGKPFATIADVPYWALEVAESLIAMAGSVTSAVSSRDSRSDVPALAERTFVEVLHRRALHGIFGRCCGWVDALANTGTRPDNLGML